MSAFGSSSSRSVSSTQTGGSVAADYGSVAASATGNRNTTILPGATQQTKSGNTTIGKGATVSYTTNVTGPSAEDFASALGSALAGQANLGPGNSRVTGLPDVVGADQSRNDSRTQFIFMGVVALLVVVLLVFRRQ